MPKGSNLTHFLDTLADESKELESLTSNAGPLAKLGQYLGVVASLEQIKQKVHQNTVERCKPQIRSALSAAYAASHLGGFLSSKNYKPTGDTRRAAVEQVQIIAGKHNIVITPASGYPNSVYKRMGAFEFGYVQGMSTRAGSKTAKRIKYLHEDVYEKTGQKSFAGHSYVAPKEFFNLGGLDMTALYVLNYRKVVAEYLQGIGR